MNTGMILDNVFPPDARVENEALTLIRNGYNVHLLCVDYSHKQPTKEIINGISVHRARLPKHLYKFSALAYTVPYYHYYMTQVVKKFIIENSIRLLHIHDIQVARSVFHANRSFKLPVVLDLHENRPEIMKYYSHVNTMAGKILISPARWKKYEYRYFREANRVIVVTNEAKRHYLDNIKVNDDKIYVVPNYVRKSFYNDYVTDNNIVSRYKDRYIILYIGETGLRRGLITAINSLSFLAGEIPDILLLIIGKSKTDHILKDLVKKNNWEKYVEFAGWQQQNLLQSYLLASKIGICPLHRNLHHDTTYANKLFQYMAFGKPVVVSDCTAQKDLVNKYGCGLVFKDRDVEDFADKILTLYKDSKIYNRIAENSIRVVDTNLNWDIAGNSLLKLYNEL